MNGRKNIFITVGFVLAVSLLASSVAVLAAFYSYSKNQFHLLNSICSEILDKEPETIRIVSSVLKEYAAGKSVMEGEDILSALGYSISDFSYSFYRQNVLFAAAGFFTGAVLFVLTFIYRNKKEARRIQELAGYLEQVNTGDAVILSAHREDDFSKLEDEIYKTVTFLYQTKEEAVQIKNNFAENLSNIAHQIKTPITAVSLSVEMMKNECGKYTEQIQKQLLRLTRLEEALLVLSRLDAGTLVLKKEEIDVFTVLSLAAENLQELLLQSGTSIEIPQQDEMAVLADLDWTMEAFINLMKNCMEHNEGGNIYCSYDQNPIYTEICIWDEGEGFAKEDVPHLFERFYRGKNAGEGGIGIGLALAREIIERQNGTIRAKNMPKGGACFEIRFYSH